MKLSAKVGYACQVLAQMARKYGQPELMHIEDLARIEAIPQTYLVQILNELRNGGLIQSKRGKQGGYSLARDPKQITMADIVRTVEGDLIEVRIESTGESARQVDQVWQKLVAKFDQMASSITLDRLIEADSEMWYI